MERDAHTELEEVVTEPAVGVSPDKVRYRRDRRVCTDPNVIAAAERESGARIAAAAPTAAGLDPRETETGAQEQTTGRLRIINGITISEKDIFIACGETKGYGYAIWRMDHDFKNAKQVLASIGGIPTGRLTTPEEVATLVVLLASPRTANVTGANYVIDGGLIKTT